MVRAASVAGGTYHVFPARSLVRGRRLHTGRSNSHQEIEARRQRVRPANEARRILYIARYRRTSRDYRILQILLGFSLVSESRFPGQILDRIHLFAHGSETSLADPILGLSTGFYLFSLPFLSNLVTWLTILVILLIGVVFLAGFYRASRQTDEESTGIGILRKPLLILAGVLLAAIAANTMLGMFRLLYSQSGVVKGAGWLDAKVNIPVKGVTAGILGVSAVLLFVSAFSRRFGEKLLAMKADPNNRFIELTGKSLIAPGAVIGTLIVIGSILPGIIDTLVVEPNEITKERPYLEHNIRFTRTGYGLEEERIETGQYDVSGNVTREVLDANSDTMRNVRLWDWRALRANLKQQQEIRLYYSFGDVDIDRYVIDGDYKQVMLALRELDKSQLAPQSQTWVSRHLKYTHGYGLALTPVHELREQGRPRLLVRNIPAEIRADGIELNRPEIYYGEMTDDHVYVKTSEQELDYPSGDENVYTTYEGDGGVEMSSLLERFIYAWKFDEYQLLFSAYFDYESRVMFHRDILDRARELAPFLTYDNDPYPVLTDDGRIKYIIDAYDGSVRF